MRAGLQPHYRLPADEPAAIAPAPVVRPRTTPKPALNQVERVRAEPSNHFRTDPIAKRILASTADLVRVPSQGGIDDAQPICDALVAKLAEAGLKGRVLMQGARPVGVVAEIEGAHAGPTYCLNAVVDTAPVGDAKSWSTLTPFSAELRGNQLVGRGVGDSKVAAAMFIEVGRTLALRSQEMHGRAVLFFDAAEHAGDFAGMLTFANEYAQGPRRVQGMIIGYPGNESLQIGSRGFHRTQWRIEPTGSDPASVASALAAPMAVPLPEGRSIEFPLASKRTVTAVRSEAQGAVVGAGIVVEVAIRGKSAHSGAGGALGVNALVKTAAFLEALRAHGATLLGDGFTPKLLAMRGGKDFSVVPDRIDLELFVPEGVQSRAVAQVAGLAARTADETLPSPGLSAVVKTREANGERELSAVTVNVDVRTTMACDIDAVEQVTRTGAAKARESGLHCDVSTSGAWPAFRLPEGSALSLAMQQAIGAHSKKAVQPRIAGPSNAGNVAAAFGIPATAGFGVVCRSAHGTDEAIDVTTIPVAYAVHVAAMELLLGMRTPANAGFVPPSDQRNRIATLQRS